MLDFETLAAQGAPRPRRRAPHWLVVFLPVTLPLYALLLTLWRLPLWLPKILALFAVSLVAGCLGWAVAFGYGTRHEEPSSDGARGMLRWCDTWWTSLTERLPYYPSWFDTRWAGLPHGMATGDGDLLEALVLLGSLSALVATVAIVAAGIVLSALKRTLEVLAQ